MIARAGELARRWPMLSPLRVRAILLSLGRRIEVRCDGIEISLFPSRLPAVLGERPSGPLASVTEMAEDTSTITISVAAELCRMGQGVMMIIDPSDPSAPAPKPDPSLVKAIMKAHRFNDRLLHGNVARFSDLANSENLHRSYYSQILRLAYLAPDITAAILEGRQPPSVSASLLIEHARLPLSWSEQRTALGFA